MRSLSSNTFRAMSFFPSFINIIATNININNPSRNTLDQPKQRYTRKSEPRDAMNSRPRTQPAQANSAEYRDDGYLYYYDHEAYDEAAGPPPVDEDEGDGPQFYRR
jgi:hypothetical protein